MAEDDRAVMERLAALEAEVKADADAQRARKDAALTKLRAQKAAQDAERADLRRSQARVAASASPARESRRGELTDLTNLTNLGDAIELAGQANAVKQELARRPGTGEKSWIISGIASLALGPLGWLYAGSMREAIPASAGWLVLAAIASKILPMFLLMPVLMVAMPLSGIAGVVYALQYNRKGGRQRLFRDDAPKQLAGK